MEKQYNLLLSLPILIKQCLFLKNQSKALQILLKKYSKKEVDQMLPHAIQKYLKTEKFDQEIAAQASRVLEKFKRNFLDHFQRQSRDFDKLGEEMEQMYKCLDQTKKNVENGILYQCKKCEKTYSTINGLNYHEMFHSDTPIIGNQGEGQNKSVDSTKSKKIKKERRQPKEQRQKILPFEVEEQDYLS